MPVEPEHPPESSDPTEVPRDKTILRLWETARSITERVRGTLLPPGVNLTPIRVLVVDDHPDAAESLAVVLEMLGCPIRACHDALSALDIAATFRPQVCLLDLMMPHIDGLELAVRLRAQATGGPLLLVAVTALGDEESRSRTALAGFHYHLVKPVDAAALIAVLVEVGRQFGKFAGGNPVGEQPDCSERVDS